MRSAITTAYRTPEPACVPPLIAEATLPESTAEAASALARDLVVALRRKKKAGGSGVEELIQEYSLSSQEGIALMCVAEALLRIPDSQTRDALIRDKISTADWRAHVGKSPSLLVNAATWGLLITGKLTATTSEGGLTAATRRLVAKGGEPLIRKGVDLAMRLMGEQFVTGQTIDEALANSRKMEARGFRYSYDCLGEAAITAADAERYYADYERAIHAIGRAAQHDRSAHGIYEGPGISVKLSALHPRYSRAQRDRVLQELLPRILALTVLARHYDIALNIDAEEADRLELSLELLEALCLAPELAGWNGIGFVIQAYQKRCRFVIDWIIELAHRSQHRLMIRLVKGAYWDSEIKRAQVDGLEGFPVFTRKIYTDVSYLACARKLLTAVDVIFPQFATHNAHTLATIVKMAGENFYPGQYEFQCLHGMGEPLYEEVVGPDKLNRPCRIYAPVGTHETLLAYLVRRLLENGANTSFVNKINDPDVSVEELTADPVAQARSITPLGAPHPKIALPQDLFGRERVNSRGLDLSNERRLAELEDFLAENMTERVHAEPILASACKATDTAAPRAVTNPADHGDVVGWVSEASIEDVTEACQKASAAQTAWGTMPIADRAAILERAAEALQLHRSALIGILVREAGKSLPNAVGEIREAVDFLRYYAAQARHLGDTGSTQEPTAAARPLGPVACISPWNFPLAIFLGQVSAALVAGNVVLAKPAEETPLIAYRAVQLLHEAGIPKGALQLLPGDGRIGAALVANPSINGVIFTGSTDVAKLIQRKLAERLNPDGTPVPLIAETGGQNAMIVDSSALAEQVVGDVLSSAFDSAGQRCSALRILCLQEEIADRVLEMLKGAMQELRVGNPGQLATDIGPVITAEAQTTIVAHIHALRERGRPITEWQPQTGPKVPITLNGTFVAPTIIEITALGDLTREVFGPVLHVLRYERAQLTSLVDAIGALGYGLTFGLHSRIDETIAEVTQRIGAGNLYVNRNIIGAVVGSQPFGGSGLSGTGPKAGGPRYLRRLLGPGNTPSATMHRGTAPQQAVTYQQWLTTRGHAAAAAKVAMYLEITPLGTAIDLPGPVGERDHYTIKPRGSILAIAENTEDSLLQIGAILATGNTAVLPASNAAADALRSLPSALADCVTTVTDWRADPMLAGVLFAGSTTALRTVNREVAERNGPLLAVQVPEYSLDLLTEEISISTNTAAAGGNAQLMTIG